MNRDPSILPGFQRVQLEAELMSQIVGAKPEEVLALGRLYFRWSKQLFLFVAILYPELSASPAKRRRGLYPARPRARSATSPRQTPSGSQGSQAELPLS